MTRLALALLLLASPAYGQTLEGVVPGRVIDGDTFSINVRLWGVDTPETGHRAQCPEEARLGELAALRADELLKGSVRVALVIRGVDRYGRILAEVEIDNQHSLGTLLKSEGLARDWPLEQAWCEGKDPAQ